MFVVIRFFDMQEQGNILEILKEREAQAVIASQRGLIIQPGALGDCILTLPLAEFMKQSLHLGRIDLLSHTEYTSIFPGRTCVDGVRSIDSVRLHRLFIKSGELDLGDCDELINAFADYQWIITFLGQADSDFERNLIFTANCSHSAEVITLQLKPPADYSSHICDFYIRRFTEQNILCEQFPKFNPQRTLIPASQADVSCGHKLLKETGLDTGGKVIVIQPGSGATCKSWHLDNFCRLAEQLQKRDFQVRFLLGPAELDRYTNDQVGKLEGVVPCISELSLTEVLGLLSCVDYFVGNDSGITHLAAALGVRTLAIFGLTNPLVYKPVGPAVQVFKSRPEDFAGPCPALENLLLETVLRA